MAPMPNLLKLLFSPAGRIGQRDYLIGLVGLVIIFSLYGMLINRLGGSMVGFFAVLAFPFIILQIAYSVFGKRLHDIGRSLWPVTGLLCAMLAAMIIVMLVYGGADYLYYRLSRLSRFGLHLPNRNREKMLMGSALQDSRRFFLHFRRILAVSYR